MKKFLKAEALAAVRAGEVEAGIAKYREYLGFDDNAKDDDAWAGLGGAYRRCGEIDRAIECYAQAHLLNAASTYALVNLVTLRAVRNTPADQEALEHDVIKAITLCEEAVKADGATFWNWYDLATVHLVGRRPAEASKIFYHAVALTPKTGKEYFRSVLNNLRFIQKHNPNITGLADAISAVEKYAD